MCCVVVSHLLFFFVHPISISPLPFLFVCFKISTFFFSASLFFFFFRVYLCYVYVYMHVLYIPPSYVMIRTYVRYVLLDDSWGPSVQEHGRGEEPPEQRDPGASAGAHELRPGRRARGFHPLGKARPLAGGYNTAQWNAKPCNQDAPPPARACVVRGCVGVCVWCVYHTPTTATPMPIRRGRPGYAPCFVPTFHCLLW